MTTEAKGGRLTGRPLARREDARILDGCSRFLDDIEMPGLAHLAFVRSPDAHARVSSIRAPEDAPGLTVTLQRILLAPLVWLSRQRFEHRAPDVLVNH